MLNILIFIILFIVGLYAFLSYSESANQEVENDIKEVINKEEEAEDKVEQPKEEEKEQIFHFGTHDIRYKIFDDCNLSCKTKIIHRDFALENMWIQEPYYSSFFRLISFIDKDVLFIKDQNSEVLLSNVRDKNGKKITTKVYNIINILDLISIILKINREMILRYQTKEAKQIVLSIFIYCISKSKQFQTVDTNEIYSIFLRDYPHKANIAYIIYLFEGKDGPLNFIQKSFKQAPKYCHRHPHTEFEEKKQEQDIKLIPELPPKILRHIY